MNLNKLTTDELTLAGKLSRAADGGFTLTLAGKPGVTPPIPPPTDAIVITPTGGDDRGHLQQAIDNLPADKTLMLSGMFNLSDTVWMRNAFSKTISGDTSKQSGMRSTNAGIMSGPYASMFCVSDSTSCRVRDLEFDAGGHPTELLYVERGDNVLIERCYLHDVGVMPDGPPFGAIHSEGVITIAVRHCRIERTGGYLDHDQGVRGIWCKGHEVWIDACNVSDTGHTGIATEGGTITITRCTVNRPLTQGTGLKMCQRPYNEPIRNRPYVQGQLYCAENSVDQTKNGGLMLESCDEAVALIERNTFKNCGSEGSTFGAIYSPYPVKGLTWRNNRVENCRSFGGLRHGRGFTFTDSTFAGGSNVLWLEDDCHQITLTRSGQVNVGSNCSEITVDGVRVA